MNRYIVWPEDSEREDGRAFEAEDHDEAARAWAEWEDWFSAEYIIARGNELKVFVALDDPDSTPQVFWVSGEEAITYHARRG